LSSFVAAAAAKELSAVSYQPSAKTKAGLLDVGKIGAKFVKFLKFAASNSMAAAAVGPAAANPSLNFGGRTLPQYLPMGGLRM